MTAPFLRDVTGTRQVIRKPEETEPGRRRIGSGKEMLKALRDEVTERDIVSIRFYRDP
jgi:hypothetical protein